MTHALVVAVRDALTAHADPVKAAGAQRYMKSAMPFYGVPMPLLRRLVKTAVAEHPLPDEDAWRPTLLDLWDTARHREDRYAALAIAAAPRYRPYATAMAAMDLYEHFVRSGAWWDLVDETSHRVGGVLAAHPAEATPLLQGWSRDPDLWIRRASIICQLDRKSQTDLDLLRYAIEGSIDDPDFFARKAIGWALRQHARVDPQWVMDAVTAYGDRLSPLSRREALKHLTPAE